MIPKELSCSSYTVDSHGFSMLFTNTYTSVNILAGKSKNPNCPGIDIDLFNFFPFFNRKPYFGLENFMLKCCSLSARKSSSLMYFLTSYKNANPITAPFINLLQSIFNKVALSLSMVFDEWIKNFPLKFVFHLLVSIVFLPSATSSAYGCLRDKHFNRFYLYLSIYR
jgi:hypothetical protein